MRSGRLHHKVELHRIVGQRGVETQQIVAYRGERGLVGRHVAAHRAHYVSAEDGEQAGAYRVRGVPHRHLGGQLGGRNPVGQQSGARRESAALKDVVEHQQDAEQHHQSMGRDAEPDSENLRAEAERHACQHAQQQSDGHVPAAVHAVGDESVHEARQTVNETYDGHYETEARVRDAVLGRKARDGEREVLAHEIEERVTDHRGDDGAVLPILEFFGLFGCHFLILSLKIIPCSDRICRPAHREQPPDIRSRNACRAADKPPRPTR